MSENTPKYLDVVANAFSATQAWKTTSILLGCVVAFLSYSIVSQARNTPVVLVPYDLASAGTNVKVTTNGEIKGTSFEYLANLAMSDLSLILNYTPGNVLTQHQRFINRLTDSLAGTQGVDLLAQAKAQKEKGVTQSFFVSTIQLSPDSTKVEVVGNLIRWQGGKEVVNTPVTYVLTYQVFKNYMHISDLRQKTEVVKNG
jgi:hypothetical protein